ncbi:MAG: glycosyltransferase [Actinomycetota bacterium]|nr:glycosyltransferase [Actinomycetota bacterium]
MSIHAAVDDQLVADRQTLRVASVPAGHVYVRHLSAPGDGVTRLPDPPPAAERLEPGQWWPPAMLTSEWVHRHAGDFDVFHVHFGFDALTAGELAAVVDALDQHGKPLVYTVHDLRNPHHAHRAAHDAHLDVLIARAAALITLTPGAADAIQQRWGRRPLVLPHPYVVEFDRMRPRPARDRHVFRVGVHAKSVRASMDPGSVVAALLPLTGELPGLQLVIDIHRDVAEPDGLRHDRALMRLLSNAAASGRIELAVHDCFTDAELWDYLEGIDLSVLPYRFGTHSGWLEACHDLGTAVLAPTCGYYRDQRACLSYRNDDADLCPDSLRAAVRQAYVVRPAWQADPVARTAERADIAAAHRAIYESVLQ